MKVKNVMAMNVQECLTRVDVTFWRVHFVIL